MADEITVVGIEPDGFDSFKVRFSEPVYYWVCPHLGLKDFWFVSDENDDIIPNKDEMHAFQWALKVIEKHKERVNDTAQNAE